MFDASGGRGGGGKRETQRDEIKPFQLSEITSANDERQRLLWLNVLLVYFCTTTTQLHISQRTTYFPDDKKKARRWKMMRVELKKSVMVRCEAAVSLGRLHRLNTPGGVVGGSEGEGDLGGVVARGSLLVHDGLVEGLGELAVVTSVQDHSEEGGADEVTDGDGDEVVGEHLSDGDVAVLAGADHHAEGAQELVHYDVLKARGDEHDDADPDGENLRHLLLGELRKPEGGAHEEVAADAAGDGDVPLHVKAHDGGLDEETRVGVGEVLVAAPGAGEGAFHVLDGGENRRLFIKVGVRGGDHARLPGDGGGDEHSAAEVAVPGDDERAEGGDDGRGGTLVHDVDDKDKKVTGDELGAGEDDHHEAEGNAEAAEHEVVGAGAASETPADLGGHQGAHAEEEAAEEGEEEQLGPSVLGCERRRRKKKTRTRREKVFFGGEGKVRKDESRKKQKTPSQSLRKG